MNKFIYLFFLSIFFLDFLHSDLGIFPRISKWIPDLFAVFALGIVAIGFGIKKGIIINLKYVYLFLLYFTIILLGILVNFTMPGEIFVGMRNHLKHIPVFLLPAVFDFSPKQFKNQLLFILPLLALQCPVAIIQRFYFIQKRIFTGDVVTGTLLGSGTLSIVMICSIAVVLAFYLKKKSRSWFFSYFIMLFVFAHDNKRNENNNIYIADCSFFACTFKPKTY